MMWRLHASRRAVQADGMPVPAEYDRDTRIRHEIEVFGFPLGCHPLDLYRDAGDGADCIDGRDMARYTDRRVTMVGWPIVDKLTHTRRGDPMAFMSFDDGTALYEAMFLPDVYVRHAVELGAPAPHVLEGVVDDDSGALSLRVTNMRLVRHSRTAECVEARR
jgi:error-prone DNA polymerase